MFLFKAALFALQHKTALVFVFLLGKANRLGGLPPGGGGIAKGSVACSCLLSNEL